MRLFSLKVLIIATGISLQILPLNDMGLSYASPPPERTDTLTALREQAIIHIELIELAAAEIAAQRCVDLSLELYGPNDARFAEDLFILAQVHVGQDRLREAADLIDTAIGLVEQQLGVRDERLVALLENRATILNRIGKHNDAIPQFERSLAIAIERWGLGHPATAGPTLGLASIQNKKGDFSGAETVYRRCLDVLRDAYGPAHPRVAEATIGLSHCLGNLGDYVEAERILRHCLEATVVLYGERSGQAGRLMLALAEVLAMLGQHVESTRWYRQAADTIEEVYGPNHSRTAAALSGLAHTIRRVGGMLEPANLYRRAINIVEGNHGSPHPDLIHYRCRLGMCHYDARRLDEAQKSIEAGIAEAIKIYGAGSYQVAVEERHLGLVLVKQERIEEAQVVLKRSLATMEACFGAEHPYISKVLKGLAQVCSFLGSLEEARAYAGRAASLYEHGENRDQTELVFLLGLKARIELRAGMWSAAMATEMKAANIALAELGDIYQVSSTREAISYARIPRGCITRLMTTATADPALSDSTLAEVFSLAVRTHGQVLDRLANRQRFLGLYADTSEVARSRREVARAAQHLSDLVLHETEDDPELSLDRLTGARRDLANAERALSAVSMSDGLAAEPGPSTLNITAASLASALPPGATLIQFVYYPKMDGLNPSGQFRPLNHYGAFRLRRINARSWDLDFVDLGYYASLDTLILEYRRVIDSTQPGSRPSAREEAEYRSVARRLYDRLWAPLIPPAEEAFSGTHPPDSAPMVFLVPVLLLNLLDFNTLLAPEGGLVIESWRLHQLSSAGDMLSTKDNRERGTGLLAVGNPAYIPVDPGSTTVGITVEPESSPGACVQAYRSPQPLPGAQKEALGVAKLFSETTGEPATVLLGPEATEEAVTRELAGKRIVHLATHGFFCEENKIQTRYIQDKIANPLLMSGLVLATNPGKHDCLLTAQDVVGMDLQQVDWVVLSACGSGLGPLFWGEGVFGLRRAFEIAGARTVLMALWRVNDTTVQKLIEQIYRHRLAGSSTIDAVRRAQLERLRDQRQRLNRIHPVLWGGIIAQGDWR